MTMMVIELLAYALSSESVYFVLIAVYLLGVMITAVYFCYRFYGSIEECLLWPVIAVVVVTEWLHSL